MKATKKKSTLGQGANSDKTPQNKLRTIKTNDGVEFKIVDTLLLKYSGLMKNVLDDDKNDQEPVVLQNVDGRTFQAVNQFLQLHRQKQCGKIDLPIKSNQDLDYIMEEMDANYVKKVMTEGDEFFCKVLEASSYMMIEELKKRLIAGLAIKLMKQTVKELKIQYDLTELPDLTDAEIRDEAKRKISQINSRKQEM